MAGRITSVSESSTEVSSPFEHPDVLVVEVHVDVAVELPVGAEELVLRRGVLLGEVAQDAADVVAGGRTSFSPPTDGRSTGGILIVAIARGG